MARLHPVITLGEYSRLLRRRRLRGSGPLVVEEKLDGVLLIAHGGRLYTGSGRRAPRRLLHALRETGADPYAAPSKLLYIELYGRCLTPGGYHLGDRECYRAALVDAGTPPAYATVEEAAQLARTLPPEERRGLAESIGALHPRSAVVHAEAPPTPGQLEPLRLLYSGREGVVVKLYAAHGYRLPPEHGAKLRGLLEVKIKHGW